MNIFKLWREAEKWVFSRPKPWGMILTSIGHHLVTVLLMVLFGIIGFIGFGSFPLGAFFGWVAGVLIYGWKEVNEKWIHPSGSSDLDHILDILAPILAGLWLLI